ncbi:MAG TPA: hypothetical protein VK494_02340, partial [Gemmatimonadaceae bacterium]|nr:hypothetical protein [Gemmatimonadaceae bacterium]
VTAPSEEAAARGVSQDRLAALFAKSSPAVLAVAGTVFGDNDEVNHRLVFGVDNQRVIPAVRAVLSQLGISSADYEIRVTAPIHMVATLRDVWRPTQAGIQIHFGMYLCSMGFNADAGAERSFITASHCTNTQGGVEGTQYWQPLSSVDPTVIATEVADPEYFTYRDDPICPRGKACRFSDSSRELYSAGVASTRGAIAQTSGANNNSLEVVGSFDVTAQDDAGTAAPVGAIVNKVGRTTGWTQGPVTNTCVNTNVFGSRIHMLCQTFVAAGVGGGDSGSGVFAITRRNNVTLVGILWGGTGDGRTFVYSPFNQIEKELGQLTATQ